MQTKLFTIIGSLVVLCSLAAIAQPATHPGAEKAMAKIVLKKNYGENLKLHSRDVVTMLKNDRVPGLNGLMFMRWRGDDPGTEIMASVQWFEKKDHLLKFYASTKKESGFKLREFDGSMLWQIEENGYAWTDGEHFLATLGGAPRPPDKMVKDLLALIANKIEDVEKEAKKNPAPAETPKP